MTNIQYKHYNKHGRPTPPPLPPAFIWLISIATLPPFIQLLILYMYFYIYLYLFFGYITREDDMLFITKLKIKISFYPFSYVCCDIFIYYFINYCIREIDTSYITK